MNRTYGLLAAAGLAALGIVSGCEGPRVGEALDAVSGSGGVSSAGSGSAGRSGAGAGSGGSVGGSESGGTSGDGGTSGAGEAGAAGSGACTGDGTSTRGPELVCIPGGTFNMGTDQLMSLPALPIHAETVESFYMDATEVTLGQYKECMAAAPEQCTLPSDATFEFACNYPNPAKDDHPINCIGWSQAEAFCEWAGKRLPTEIEWEYSARGPQNRTHPWGGAAPEYQWCWAVTVTGTTCPVGSYPSGNTPEGLSDLAGNVWEMTASYYCTYSDQGVGPPCDENIVIRRGGAFTSQALYHANAGFREELVPAVRRMDVGFRCAR